MPEFDHDAVVRAVQYNCHVSDAQFAGDLTLCTFLLKMRELYRWEHGIPLSRDLPRAEVGEWMNRRGEMWDGLEQAEYRPIPLPGGALDAFETTRVNAVLRAHGLVYSGGYGRHCKPHFFIGELTRHETRAGRPVHVVGRELARDLEAPPGMYLDGALFVRTEALRRWLWEKYEEWRWNRKNPAMARAFAAHAFETDAEAALERMAATESETIILHELGEADAGERYGVAWEALLQAVFRERAEIIVRAVRDLYADCQSTLPGLLAADAPAAVHFYFANFVGMRRRLAPELAQAYAAWVEHGAADGLAQAVAAGAARWRAVADELLDLHATLGEQVGAAIEARLAPKEAC